MLGHNPRSRQHRETDAGDVATSPEDVDALIEEVAEDV